ncbi:MAG: glycoside hydrolase family 3 C-terminal domain-containing protein [Clostridiales bacterium]|nr:glycoside hydrolase family 3 C-terminal domain-containing protein [Clostridiales bacterium]
MERNVKELVAKMTLEEKAGMCSGQDFWHLKGVERLGIPGVMVSDGPHGLRKQDDKADHLGINESIRAVCFPPAVLSACSFDRELLEEMGVAIGKEAQATDLSVILGPAVNIKRSPLCGRNFEYYSEDPYLAGEAAAAFINGVQSQHVGTSLKHFAANNQEYNRMNCSSEVDERTMREIYLPAFETAVKKSQPYTVMCSYNRLNGTFASEHPWLLTEVLRDEWGFKGYVMSDWGAVNDRVEALKAGLELEMPASGGINDQEIVRAVTDGTLDEAILNRSVERILSSVFRYLDNRQEETLNLNDDHELARHIAEESIVLLKNEDSILPLSAEESVAFIGGFAKTPRFQGGGSSHINSFRVDSALDMAAAAGYTVSYAQGYPANDDVYEEDAVAEAIRTAAAADKAVIFAGLPDSFESEGYDRSHMHLPDCQNRLIDEILRVQPNTIVVLHNGSPVEMPWRGKVKGIVEAYLGGQAVGGAVVNILYGKVNPSGKLAETLPIKLSDNPAHLNFGDGAEVHYQEGIFVGYRYYDAKEMEVAFPFGHGLSYTEFRYSNLRTDKSVLTDTDTLTVSVDVTNTGNRTGKEAVQFYVADRTGTCRRPKKELKGFKKVALEPGETKTVSVTFEPRSFSWYNTDLHDWFIGSGTYEILAGSSSRDIRQSLTLQMNSAQKLPLKLHMNTTFGELLSDPRTREYGLFLKKKMDDFFGDGSEANESESSDEAVSDAMSEAIAASIPLRNVVSFGLCTKEEVAEVLEKLSQNS